MILLLIAFCSIYVISWVPTVIDNLLFGMSISNRWIETSLIGSVVAVMWDIIAISLIIILALNK